MANPSIGISYINTTAPAAHSFTTPTGQTSAASGSTFLIAVSGNDGLNVTVSDSFGNTYTKVTLGSGINPIEDTNDINYLWLFMCVNGTGGANHTATANSTSNVLACAFIEVQNTDTTSPVDVSASAYGGTSPLSLSVTTTQANDLILGFGMSATGHADRPVTTAGTGFTGLLSYNDTLNNLGVGYLAGASAAAHNPSFTHLGGSIGAITIAFIPGSSGDAGSGAIAEGTDTAAGSGAATDSGSGTIAEGVDTAVGSGTSGFAGSGAIAEGADAVAGSGTTKDSGSGAIAEGADTVAGTGSTKDSGSGTIAEGADTTAGTGSTKDSGSGTIAEGADTVAGSGSSTPTITGSGAITEGVVPNIAALPASSSAVPPWSAFLSATGGKSGWALNTPYTDSTGAVMRRLTNRSTLTDGGGCNMEYAEGGPRISQQFGGNRYWVAFQDNAGTGDLVIGQYQLGTGFISVFKPSAQITSGNLGVCFSMLPGEQHICYLANSGSTTIHRFDVNANAYASNSVFSGTNASIDCGINPPGWLQNSWDGTRLVWQAPVSGPTSIFRLMTQTGSLATYTGSTTSTILLKGGTATGGSTTTLVDSTRSWSLGPTGNGQWGAAATLTMTSGLNSGASQSVTSNTATTLTFPAFAHAVSAGDTYNLINVNEPHMMKGSADVVFLEDNSNAGSFPYAWFPATNVCAQSVGYTYSQYGGHSDAGASNLYTLNPQGSYTIVQEYTPGTAPASDGGAWNGAQSNYWGTTPANNIDSGGADGHWNTSWGQLGAGANEWATKDSAGEPHNKNTVSSWSVFSGNIYQGTVTFGNYGASGRGVVGVLTYNGTAGSGQQITGNLTSVGSTGAMTAGTYYWNGTTLYVWMPAGGSPSGKVIISAASWATNTISYVKQDGSQIRDLCWQYTINEDGEANYYNNPMVNVSPDGLLVIFNSDLGTYDGYVDLVGVEVPTISSSDVVAGVGATGSTISGSGSIAEGADVTAGSGATAVSGSGTIAEAHDTMAGTGAAGGAGSGVILEGADTVAGTGGSKITGAGAIAEVPDTVVGAGTEFVPISGSGAISEASDIVTGIGTGSGDTCNFSMLRPVIKTEYLSTRYVPALAYHVTLLAVGGDAFPRVIPPPVSTTVRTRR